jgi:predicted  nucleic acid-binding Zn-ribbon protein
MNVTRVKCYDCNANLRVVGGTEVNHFEDFITFCPHCAHSVNDEGVCDCSNCRKES